LIRMIVVPIEPDSLISNLEDNEVSIPQSPTTNECFPSNEPSILIPAATTLNESDSNHFANDTSSGINLVSTNTVNNDISNNIDDNNNNNNDNNNSNSNINNNDVDMNNNQTNNSDDPVVLETEAKTPTPTPTAAEETEKEVTIEGNRMRLIGNKRKRAKEPHEADQTNK